MIRIYTRAIIAAVQNMHFWIKDRTISYFPSHSMSLAHRTESPKAAVAMFVFAGRPNNAPIGRLFGFAVEPINYVRGPHGA